jgi:hypothetical protein
MERYSLIVVTDATKPVRRFDTRWHAGARASGAAGCALLPSDSWITCACGWTTPSRRLRRRSGSARTDRGLRFGLRVVEARGWRNSSAGPTIANLPGQAAAGGEDVERWAAEGGSLRGG